LGNGLGFRKTVNATSVTLETVQENCSDHVDNDGDGLTDCDDPKCSDVPICMGITRTPTPPVTPTPTATGLSGATATPPSTPGSTATPTPTGTPEAVCVGDCNGSGEVTVNEVILGVNIALGQLQLDACPAFDVDGSGSVTVNELIMAVNNALSGCPVPG